MPTGEKNENGRPRDSEVRRAVVRTKRIAMRNYFFSTKAQSNSGQVFAGMNPHQNLMWDSSAVFSVAYGCSVQEHTPDECTTVRERDLPGYSETLYDLISYQVLVTRTDLYLISDPLSSWCWLKCILGSSIPWPAAEWDHLLHDSQLMAYL